MQSIVRFVSSLFLPSSVSSWDWKLHSDIYVLRLVASLFVVLLPASAVFFYGAQPTATEEWLLRGAMTVAAAAVLAWTFISTWAKDNAGFLLLLLAILITAWSAFSASTNSFEVDYAIGSFMMVVATAMFVSLASDTMVPVTIYSIFSLTLSVVLMFITPELAVNSGVYIASLLMALSIVYVAASARIQVQDALFEQEGHLAEAQRLASVGNWEVNLQNGQARWSTEMIRILGLDPESNLRSFDEFADRVHSVDRPALKSFWGTLRNGHQHDDITLGLDAVDGTVRTIRLRGAYAPATSNRPERLHGTCLDVTEETGRAQVLLRAKEDAEEMARLKSTILVNMSHEIRTPLTAIIGFAQVLSQEVDSEKRELVKPIEESGKRLLSTLDSVLDLARIKSDSVALSIEPVDVGEEAHDLADMFRPLAKKKGLTLIVNAPVSGVTASADRHALNRVFSNLLSNAIKFSETGKIILSVKQTDSIVYIRVSDTGC
ncbi:MAG: HAMP domain-containing histidine kinase [Bacteroidetes bacterium]|nr:HAMP domain-containing histidine kinase [Bacteroidota bacterium]